VLPLVGATISGGGGTIASVSASLCPIAATSAWLCWIQVYRWHLLFAGDTQTGFRPLTQIIWQNTIFEGSARERCQQNNFSTSSSDLVDIARG
jgi:hypothetical protein